MEYKWQRATSFSPFIIWQDLANTNADTYDPGTITQTTKYRRLVKVTCENTWLESNIVTMTISYTPFIWNGNAYPTGDSCFVLTPDEFGQDGSVWYQNYMSLNYDFDLSFNVFLGYDDDGADGIAFVLQPLSTGAGGAGGGIGYYGISPSIAVEYDTWENDDPSEDHISIQPNGDVSTNSSSMGLAIMPNIEDGLWHNTRITWEHATKTLRVYWEGTLKLSLTNDLATNFFGGNPNVYWGMTGATGAAKNLQEFCVTTQTFQEALFNVSQTNITCHNDNNASATASLLFGDVTFDGWYQGVNLFSSSLSISGLAAGTYTAKAHNSLGQTSQQDVIIINPDAVTFTTNVVQVSCNGCSDGQIIVNATGGNGTYYYSMYPFGSYQFSNVFSGLPSGSYKLRVFDGNYCYSDTQTVNFVLLCTNPANGGSISGDQNICNVNPPATLASVSPASGQTGTLEYKWQYSVAPFSVWNDISSSNVEDLSFLSPVTQTTKYKRLARVDCMPDWSGALESNVATLTNNTTVIVTNNMNDGVGSLRYAINNVCNNGYILFDAGIDGQTIALATGAITINKNITFDNCSHSAGITIMGVGDNFIINSGKSLTINACSKITVRGRIQNNAGVSGLVLASGASFIYDFCELPATAQRTLNYGWHLFGSPFKQSAGATRANVTPASGSQLLPYTNGSAWGLNITSPYYFLQPTVGYALKPNAGFTASLSGMLFCSTCLPCPCDYSVSLTYSGVASDKSWNLLANPYTSYLNWNLLGKTNLSNTLYFWDNALNAGTPTTNASYFRTYNASNGVGVPAGTQPYIAPFQGFFVKALVANPKLTFPYAARTHSSASFYKEGGTEILVRLKTETETAIDELVVCKSADAKNAFEEFDSEKMFNGLPIEMYTQTSGGEKLIINTIDNTNTVIPIGINITNGSKAKITAFGLESAEHVYLEDRLKGKLISLSENTAYEFDFSSEAILERFFIRFGDINTPLSNSDVKVYTNEHQLNIIAQTGEEIQQVEVYSLTGACVYSSKLSGSNVFNSTLDLSADIYLVRVKTSLATQNVKLNWK